MAISPPCPQCLSGEVSVQAPSPWASAGKSKRSWTQAWVKRGQPHALCLSVSCCSSRKGRTAPGRRGLARGLLGARSRAGPLPLEGCLSTWRAQGLNVKLHPAWSQLRSQITEVQEDLNLFCLLQMKEEVSGKYFISPAGSGCLPPFLPLLQPHLLHL